MSDMLPDADLPRLYEPHEVAEALRVSENWLEKAARHKHIPHLRCGRKLRFSAENVRQIVQMTTVLPISGSNVDTPQRSSCNRNRKTFGRPLRFRDNSSRSSPEEVYPTSEIWKTTP